MEKPDRITPHVQLRLQIPKERYANVFLLGVEKQITPEDVALKALKARYILQDLRNGDKTSRLITPDMASQVLKHYDMVYRQETIRGRIKNSMKPVTVLMDPEAYVDLHYRSQWDGYEAAEDCFQASLLLIERL